MAPKDYVSRGRAAKKPPAPAPAPKPSLPWIRIVITLVLVGGFGYFLWSIKDKAETVSSQTSQNSQQQEDPLPEMEDEVWDYPYILSDSEVQVEVEEQQLSSKPYLMQCGSFRQKSQAEEMKAKIAFQGLEAQVRSSSGQNGVWYRVILGPYVTKRSAEVDRHQMRRIDITTCRIWYWNL